MPFLYVPYINVFSFPFASCVILFFAWEIIEFTYIVHRTPQLIENLYLMYLDNLAVFHYFTCLLFLLSLCPSVPLISFRFSFQSFCYRILPMKKNIEWN